eukprot:scaffold128987_cov18-Phaeocystis_antarctica.AAC.1
MGVAAWRADLTLLSTCRSELLYLLSIASPAAEPLPGQSEGDLAARCGDHGLGQHTVGAAQRDVGELEISR